MTKPRPAPAMPQTPPPAETPAPQPQPNGADGTGEHVADSGVPGPEASPEPMQMDKSESIQDSVSQEV